MREDLTTQKCIPCEGGTPPFNSEEIQEYLVQVSTEWGVTEDKKLSKKFKFKNFKESMDFVNKVADIAESEGHHPDITINYNRVLIELTTHSIGGLSKNDFIVAAKVEKLLP